MQFLEFFLIMYPFMLVPGPAMALVARSAAKFGVFKTNFYIIGILTSITFFSILSILGVVSIIQLYPKSFLIFRFIGAIYLFIVGIKIFITSLKPEHINVTGNIQKSSNFKQYLFGLGTDLANPLTIVGITSMILGFVDPADTIGTKIGYLITTIISAVCYLYTYAFLFGNKVSKKFITPRMGMFEKLSGIAVCFIGFIFFINTLENLL